MKANTATWLDDIECKQNPIYRSLSKSGELY